MIKQDRSTCRKTPGGPGAVACGGSGLVKNAVEIEITTHCNLGCYNCDRSARQAPSKESMSLAQILFFIRESLKLNKSWDYISLLGGEPTLHPRLLTILEAFKYFKFDPDKLQVVTNGYSGKVRAVLKRLPPWVLVNNTNKKTPFQKFRWYNLAPVDFGIKNASPCGIPRNCGYGLTRYGFYPCGAGASIDRVFGLGMGIRHIRDLTARNTAKQLKALCRYCGHSPSLDKRLIALDRTPAKGIFQETSVRPGIPASQYIAPMSGSWVKAYKKYHAKKPALRLYGIAGKN